MRSSGAATPSTPTGPFAPQLKLPDRMVWNNLVTEEVSKVAERLDELRGRYRYT
ncbi:hypothetical protein [Variovorax rhizosphaerae]|uniref:Uncharacterized protein n=1 Tax=Variovorax rhizosphaerae TaxID=1836200 RepID=A0ABU8WYE7_9BURK